MRCTYASKSRESVGKSKLTTWPTSGRSRPLEATSVATRTRTAPAANASNALVLAPCEQSPCSSSAEKSVGSGIGIGIEPSTAESESAPSGFAPADCDDAAFIDRAKRSSASAASCSLARTHLASALAATKTRVRFSSGRDLSTAKSSSIFRSLRWSLRSKRWVTLAAAAPPILPTATLATCVGDWSSDDCRMTFPYNPEPSPGDMTNRAASAWTFGGNVALNSKLCLPSSELSFERRVTGRDKLTGDLGGGVPHPPIKISRT
mmetsp:Transcript_9284/g.37557  ORF Transcript_9284/g.37557 Transcript_9284/m.37557 type:complete len:263 (-) Transcript_9284:1266-2054(-)